MWPAKIFQRFLDTVVCKRCLSQSFVHQSTSCAKNHTKVDKSSSLLRYCNCFLSNHTVGCCNINFSCLSQTRREKICFACNVSVFFLYFFAWLQLFRCHIWPTFHRATPWFFVLTSLFILIACWKTNFFLMFMGNYWERNREREKFRLNRFPIVEAKVIFCTVLRFNSNDFLQFSLGIVEKQLKKRQAYRWLKKKEPGERNVTFCSLILMFIFNKKCLSLEHVKMQKFALQHPIIFGVFASPWTTLKTEKRKFAFSWEMKSVSGHRCKASILFPVSLSLIC